MPASATAGAILTIRRGSKGRGMMYSGPKPAELLAVGGGDDVALLDARQLGDRLHRRELHLVGDGRRADVERTTEDEGEAQHVVHLVRVVRTAGGDDRVVAHRLDLLGQDLRGRVGQRQDQRIGRHLRHHLALEHAAGRQAEEHVGALDDLGELARVGLLGVARLDRVHQRGAAFIDHALDVGDPDVLDRACRA